MANKTVSDFITEGILVVRGEHIYMSLMNPFSGNSYLFQLPKSLFCMMIRNRLITKDVFVWKNKDEEKDKTDEENKKKLSKLAMYG